MKAGHRGDVLRQFQTLFTVGTLGGLSDGELLDRSAMRSGAASEVAFAALVERHGPMVLRVCRKALGDPHEAHDAFQSTFLILARKADAIRRRDSVASWLHGVALRVSAASRTAAARRRRHERARAGASPSTTVMEDQPDLGGVLHEEVGRLPARYRAAVVLCYLEGRTYEEVASCLQVPVGTVKSRLAWARERLRVRLSMRGFTPAAAGVATMLAAESAEAVVPLPSFWVETTTEAAIRFAAMKFAAIGSGMVPGSSAALAQGVMRVMILHNLKIVGTLGTLVLAASGIGFVAQEPGPSPAPVPAPAAVIPLPAPSQGSSLDTDRLAKLESKLDRLISALENAPVASRPASRYGLADGSIPATSTLPPLTIEGTSNLPPAVALSPTAPAVADFSARPAVAPRIAATVQGTSVARKPARATSAFNLSTVQPSEHVLISTKRLEEIEARLAALEKKLKTVEAEGGSVESSTTVEPSRD